MRWELAQVDWLVRTEGHVAVTSSAVTCSGCHESSVGTLTACCGKPICINCVYGSRPHVCPLCGAQSFETGIDIGTLEIGPPQIHQNMVVSNHLPTAPHTGTKRVQYAGISLPPDLPLKCSLLSQLLDL